MAALDNTPENLNPLSPLNHKLMIKKAPHVVFFLQKVNIPGLDLPPTQAPNPFVNIPHAGEHITFNQLHIEFQVDEDLKNFIEIQGWLFALGFPNNFEEYSALSSIPQHTGDGLRSDISLMILNSAKQPNYEITFRDAFPVKSSDLVFDTTNRDVNYLVSGASFAYVSYKISKVNG